MKNNIIYIIISISFLNPLLIKSQNSQTIRAIVFTDYGPAAFDSFWRLPDDEFNKHYLLRITSRISTDHYHNNYFTQYLRSDIPLGCGHTLSIRMPLHYFEINQNIMQNLDAKNNKGIEFGDIDIIFNISFFQNFLSKVSKNRLFIYLTAEMHTAPTSRENRQFTDAIKLLGTLNGVYSIIGTDRHALKGLLSIGGGGWDDLVRPYQKHAIKLSSRLTHKITFRNKQGIGMFIGQTYLYAEGENNEGIYWKTGFFYWKDPGIRLELNLGHIKYTQVINNFVRQYELAAFLPIVWNSD